MRLIIKSSLIALIASLWFSSYAQVVDSEVYEVGSNETLLEIAEKHFSKRERSYQNINGYVNDLKRWNSHIKDFQNLATGAQLYLDFPYSPFVTNDYAPKLLASNPKYNPTNKNAGLHMGIAFTASKGDFFETIPELADVSFQQNSPVSIGLGGSYNFYDSDFSIGYSGYWSKLTAASNNIDSDTLTVKPEIGGNLYAQYNFSGSTFGVYTGMDIERFSTFNVSDVSRFGDDLKLVETTIMYATFGLSKSFSLFSKPALIKASVAKSISSSIDQSLVRDPTTFQGNRYLFFFQHRVWKKFWYHILYKQHELEGPTSLLVQRIGFGVGWGLF